MSALETLAARLGIEPEFRDARGQPQHMTADVQRSLLQAMGVSIETEAEATQALDTIDAEEWRLALPPVVVVCGAVTPTAVDIVVPASTEVLSWSLHFEDGTQHHAKTDPATLALVATRSHGTDLLEKRRLLIDCDLPHGYHRLSLTGHGRETILIVAPEKCWLPDGVQQGQRYWGVSAQLYLLRSANNWGIGDFTDLRQLVEMASAAGADIVGVNPLHAMFLDDPEQASPYSPATRLLLNVLNIDVAAVPELSLSPSARQIVESVDFKTRLDACRQATQVPYTAVAALKLELLASVFADVWPVASPERDDAFRKFCNAGGENLRHACLFQVLRSHFANLGPADGSTDWHRWPVPFRDPVSPEVQAFAETHSDQLNFQMWLQWIADSQLATAAAAAANMAVGIYRDLAVGSDRGGAETWCNPTGTVSLAQIGCPPDIFNPLGQDWGLPPFQPRALRQEAYHSFIDLVRANMRHAGGLRIDHVMALQHLYWVPTGRSPVAGGYVQYPLNDLVAILALESHRNRCLVVGEDLGTVPEGFRETMAAANILSYRVLFFEKDATSFILPADYPRLALAVTGSHDLPTLRAWWKGDDIALRERLRLFVNAEDADEARQERDRERDQLLAALSDQDLLAADAKNDVKKIIDAVHLYLARSQAAFVVTQLDDVTDETTPVNVPTTSSEHPNWRRKLSLTLEEIAAQHRLDHLSDLFAERKSISRNEMASQA